MEGLRFESREEGEKRRQEEFLALSPSERFLSFLRLCEQMALFEHRGPSPDKGNFVLTRSPKAEE